MENSKTTFCPHCGTVMETAEVGGRVREVCSACGFILYRNPVPGVGVLVEMETSPGGGSGIVLIQRGQPPFEGRWALPAGFIRRMRASSRQRCGSAKRRQGSRSNC